MRSGTALSASRRDTIHLYPVSQLAECTNGSTEPIRVFIRLLETTQSSQSIRTPPPQHVLPAFRP